MPSPPSPSPPGDAALASALAALGGDARAFLAAAFRCAAAGADPFPQGADVAGELHRMWREAQDAGGRAAAAGGAGAAPATEPAQRGAAATTPPPPLPPPPLAKNGAAAAVPQGATAPAHAASTGSGGGAKEAKEEQAAAEVVAGTEAPTTSPALLKPNAGNGADLPAYSWTQTLAEVVVTIPLAGSGPGGALRAADCDVSITRTRLRAGAKGGPPILDGPLAAPVQADECLWSVVDGRALELTLAKVDAMRWWGSVVEGEPAIDTATVEPESSKLGDLDGETRATVEKMMWDQRQKALGLPTSEEAARAEALRKFMAAHPEMDFSQAKIG